MARPGLTNFYRWVRGQPQYTHEIKYKGNCHILGIIVEGAQFEWTRIDDVFAFEAHGRLASIYIELVEGQGYLNSKKADIEATRKAYLDFLTLNFCTLDGLIHCCRWIRVQFPPIRNIKYHGRGAILWTTVAGVFFEWRRISDVFAFEAHGNGTDIYIELEAGLVKLNGKISNTEAVRKAYLDFLG